MRSGFGVHMIGEFSGPLASMPMQLRDIGLHAFQSGQTSAALQSPVRMIALPRRIPLAELRLLQEQWADEGVALVAVLPSSDPSLVAMAAAIDCDDAIVAPIDAKELAIRLDNLCNLARRRQELTFRDGLLRSAMSGSQTPPRQRCNKPISILLAGPLGAVGGRIGDMLRPAQIVYAETPKSVAAHLTEQQYDMIIAEVSVAKMDWQAVQFQTHSTRAWIIDPLQHELRGRGSMLPADRFDDVIPATLPSDLLRARLRILRRLTTIGQELSHPEISQVPASMMDAATATLNGAFAQIYLDARRHKAARPVLVFDLTPVDLGQCVRDFGYAGLGQWFKQTAIKVKQRIRCDDLICHMGEGRFRIALQDCAAQQGERIANRLIEGFDGRLIVNVLNEIGTQQAVA